ncbi:hypothetical protein GWI33_014265 [Rhynchophorus ferrugineus]|uniref:Uncharacterized protein n=1 Tax=Rhynchophorus ferrugineus TaxID=354439 RepID=A0A834I208_RHYFE|nr:hypothetical protein GWI33_014265 [Rhynchophorus ferrugineus]
MGGKLNSGIVKKEKPVMKGKQTGKKEEEDEEEERIRAENRFKRSMSVQTKNGVVQGLECLGLIRKGPRELFGLVNLRESSQLKEFFSFKGALVQLIDISWNV